MSDFEIWLRQDGSAVEIEHEKFTQFMKNHAPNDFVIAIFRGKTLILYTTYFVQDSGIFKYKATFLSSKMFDALLDYAKQYRRRK